MKPSINNKHFNIAALAGWVLPCLVILAFAACKKYNYLGYTPGSGAPTITSVHTYYKTDTTPMFDTVITYNAAGTPTYTVNQLGQQSNAFDSVTTAGVLGNTYLIEGSNLGSATSVTFNGYTAYFNPAYSTDHSILVQLPSKTPYYGPQANDTLSVVTTHGTVNYKFTIIPPAPTVAAYSDLDFTSTGGFQMTLAGVGFATVTSVTLQGTVSGSAAVNIVSQNDSILVLSFPSTPVTRGILAFAYSSNGATDSAKGTQELVNVDNAYQIFANGVVAPNWGSWSYDNVNVSTTHAITASASYQMQFSGPNGYKVDGLRNGAGNASAGIPYSRLKAIPTWCSLSMAVRNNSKTMYVEFGGGARRRFWKQQRQQRDQCRDRSA